ncbi:MAG: hypothetical protein ACJ76H_08595 [Bacteriovoracaceae bacterium]
MKVLLLLVLSFSSAWASVQSFVIQDKKISIDVPGGWQGVKDLYGLPLVVLGPWENSSRPAISWMYTGMTKKIMKEDEFRKIFTGFKEDKESWLKEHSGKLLKFEQPTEKSFSKDLSGHFIGAEFVVNDIHFIERSYYLYCKDEVYNVKWSIRDEHRKYLAEIDKIVGSTKCP